MPALKIQPAEFQAAVDQLLVEFGDEVYNAMSEVIPEVSREATKELKSASPYQIRTGKYNKGWKDKTEKKNVTVTATVYNDKQYRLTHLLEFGHAKVNGGRTRAFEHIAPVNDAVEEKVIKKLREKIES